MATKVLVRGPLPRYITIPDGGLAIGGVVADGIPMAVPFIDVASLLAQSADFTFDPDNVGLVVKGDSAFAIGCNIRAENIDGSGGVYVTAACTESESAANANLYAESDLAQLLLQVGTEPEDFLALSVTPGLLTLKRGGVNVFSVADDVMEIANAIKLNNTVSAAAAAVSTHKMAINIGGTEYYAMLVAV